MAEDQKTCSATYQLGGNNQGVGAVIAHCVHPADHLGKQTDKSTHMAVVNGIPIRWF